MFSKNYVKRCSKVEAAVKDSAAYEAGSGGGWRQRMGSQQLQERSYRVAMLTGEVTLQDTAPGSPEVKEVGEAQILPSSSHLLPGLSIRQIQQSQRAKEAAALPLPSQVSRAKPPGLQPGGVGSCGGNRTFVPHKSDLQSSRSIAFFAT